MTEAQINEPPCLSESLLRRPFKLGQASTESLGIEIELAAVDPETGLSRSYAGPNGIKAFLESLVALNIGTAIIEKGQIIGLKLDTGGTFTLEPGGAVEYSAPPFLSLAKLADDVRHHLNIMAKTAAKHDIALMATGSFPFQNLSRANWMPKQRYDIMRAYFKSLGYPARDAWRMMSQTLSVQTAVDFLDEADLARKFHVLTVAAPIATAIFANSPMEEGKLTGLVSRRGQIWQATDPDRCGFVPPALNRDMRLDDYIEWALDVPSMYREVPDGFVPLHGRKFRDIICTGFEDGKAIELNDWEVHLGGIFTDIRLKHFLEVRCMDGQGYDTILSVPAFWAGLCYHQANLSAASDLLGGGTLEQYQDGLAEIVKTGLKAQYLGRPVQETAAELMRLARVGLQARVDAGFEPETVLSLLDPLNEIVDSGVTSAERIAQNWTGAWNQSPAKFVAATAVPIQDNDE